MRKKEEPMRSLFGGYSLKSEEWDLTPMGWYLTLWICQNGTNL